MDEKEFLREYMRLRRLAFPSNPEVNREYVRLSRLAFPEQHRGIAHRYRQSEKGQARQRRYRRSERGRAVTRRFWESPKGRALDCAHSGRRRARKRGVLQGDPAAIARIYARKQELRQQGANVVVDHIIPLAKGGPHSPENLQIIYAIENNRKSDRLDYELEVIFT